VALLAISDNLRATPRDALGATIVPDRGGAVSGDPWCANNVEAAPEPEEPVLVSVSVDAAGGDAPVAFPGRLPRPPADHLGVLGDGGSNTGAVGAVYLPTMGLDIGYSLLDAVESEEPQVRAWEGGLVLEAVAGGCSYGESRAWRKAL
jgi:hypothetical protein